MPTVVLNISDFPSLLTITNLIRSKVRDDMPGATGTIGEGQILVNNMQISVTMANFFNEAVKETARALRIIEAPCLIADNYIIEGIPPLSGPLGLATADPTVQVWISSAGYYNGSTLSPQWRLPSGVYDVERVWERETASNDNFCDMGEPAQGLAGVYQTSGFGRWEWRQNRINLPGSLDTRDLRVRYKMLLTDQIVASIPTSQYATTYVPILDCSGLVAAKVVRMYAYRQGGTMYQMALQEEATAKSELLDPIVHRMQGANYPTQAYGDESPPVISWGI